MVEAKKAALGTDLAHYFDPENPNTPTNPFALKRTFGKEGPIRVKLYRDHAAWCPYCHKVCSLALLFLFFSALCPLSQPPCLDNMTSPAHNY
jgi:hypothetical protein